MEKKMKINSTQKIQLAGASLLLLCILPLPYGFYTIVRIVTTIISAYLAYEYYTQHKKGLAITFSIVAVLFQPFIKFTLGREIWLIVDILVGGFLLALVFKDKLRKKQQKELIEPKANSIQIPILADEEIEDVKNFALSGWVLGETHGLSHWQRVERNGIILSMENGRFREDINIKVVRFFAYLHDKCRLNDWADLDHGVRSADMLLTIRDTILKDFTDEEVSLLEKACRYHTTELRTGIPTIDVCFDADRLDLCRVGITPNPKLMASKEGAYYATNIHLLNSVSHNSYEY